MNKLQEIIGNKPMNIVVPTVLFIILSPNFLIDFSKFKKPLLPTNIKQVAIHALIFALVYTILRKQFAQFY